VCVCVSVCERERDIERERGLSRTRCRAKMAHTRQSRPDSGLRQLSQDQILGGGGGQETSMSKSSEPTLASDGLAR